MMTDEQRKQLRRAIGNAVRHEQDIRAEAGMPPNVVLSEILAALLSLAAYISGHNAGLSYYGFMAACEAAAAETYGIKRDDHKKGDRPT